jgi:hypothetical protein
MKFETIEFGESKKDVLFFFPFWRSPRWFSMLFSKLLARKFRVVLYDYSQDILCSSLSKTLGNFTKIVKEAETIAKKHSKQGKKVFVLGTSIGSYLSFLLMKKSKYISKAFIVTSSAKFTDFVWYGVRTNKIRSRLQKEGITYSKASDYWRTLDPSYNVEKVTSKIHFSYSKNDQVIPSMFGEQLYLLLDEKKLLVSGYESNILHHIPIILWNLIRFRNIERFFGK